MEEIPLSCSPRVPRFRTPMEMDAAEWKARYKQVLDDTKVSLDNMLEHIEWVVVKEYATRRIKVYRGMEGTSCCYKIEGILGCSAKNVIRVHSDTDFVTRSKWDMKEITSYNERETYVTHKEGNFKVVDFTFAPDGFIEAMMGKPYYFLGVHVVREFPQDSETRSFFCSTAHQHFKCPVGHYRAQAMIGLHVNELLPTDDKLERCFARLMVKIKLPSKPVWRKHYEKNLFDRLYLYELVVQERWDELYGEQAQAMREKERRE